MDVISIHWRYGVLVRGSRPAFAGEGNCLRNLANQGGSIQRVYKCEDMYVLESKIVSCSGCLSDRELTNHSLLAVFICLGAIKHLFV